MNQKYIVVAGNYDQFRDFKIKKMTELWNSGMQVQQTDFVYADGDNLRGISNPRGFFIGTWRERLDAMNILLMLRMASHTQNPVLETLWRDMNDRP
jgi:hypothetical protein